MLRWNPLIRQLPAAKMMNLERLNKRVEISESQGFVYFRVPKSANSTVLSTLISHDPDRWGSFLKDDPNGPAKEGYRKPYDLGILGSMRVLERYFCFTFVRNPYDRVLSAYLDKIVQKKNKKPRVTKALGKTQGAEVSFADFVRLELTRFRGHLTLWLERSPRWPSRNPTIPRNSGNRWWSWSGRAGTPTS